MSCRGLLCICGVFAVTLLCVRSPVVAAFSFKVDGIEPLSLSFKEQEVKVVLSIVSLPSESYFRAAFQKEGSDAYMGYLKNERGEWVKIKSLETTECTDYFRISDTSITQAVVFIKLGEDTETETGSYRVKAHRYTSTCKSYSESSESGTYNLLLMLPSPTPSPTFIPTSTPQPTATPAPTQTPTIPNTPSPTMRVIPTLRPTTRYTSAILGIQQTASDEATAADHWLDGNIIDSTPASALARPMVFSLLFVGMSVGLLSFALAIQKTDLWKKHLPQSGQRSRSDD